MRRIRIEKPMIRRERPWLEVLPLDPRDPEIVRAKALWGRGQTMERLRPRTGGTMR
jgi:hypothetical protein